MKLLAAVCLLAGITLAALHPAARAAGVAQQCAPHVAQWLDPSSGDVIASRPLLDRLASRRIVLLGEVHTNAAHHRWQHYMLAALHSRKPDMIIGLEMLPRRAQAVLDGWTAGRLDETAFLRESEWDEVWGYDAALYLPLLHFARLNRVPAVALNIDRQLVSKVGERGWQSLPRDARMGLSDPAPASEAYRRSLAQLYAYKQRLFAAEDGEAHQEDPNLDDILQSEGFDHFVDAQLTWDRAMAEALAQAHEADPNALIVAIVGRGHIESGHGIPWQLADLGIDDVAVLLPLDADDNCAGLPADIADAVFVTDATGDARPPARPRLGVMIEDGDGGVRVMEVVDGSVADSSGLRAGDLILRAAGFDTATTSSLIEVIQRQAPGTWLPLRVAREGEEIEITARFPQSFE